MALCAQVPESILGVQKKIETAAKQKDAYKASMYNGMTGIPLLDDLVKGATSMMTGFLADASSAAVTYVTKSITDKYSTQLGNVSYGIAEGLAGITMLTNLGTAGKLVFTGMLAQQLQNQLALRISYYYDLQYHYDQLHATLIQLIIRTQQTTGLRTKVSRDHVYLAWRAATLLQQKLQYSGIWSREYFDVVHAEAELAKNYLTEYKELDASFIQKLKPAKRGAVRRLWKYMEKRFNKEILSKTLWAIDSLFWHSEQILTILPTPFKQLYSAKRLTSGIENRLPGYTSSTFNVTVEAEKYDAFVTSTKTKQPIIDTVKQVDRLKGLTLTNLTIQTFIQSLSSVEVDWDSLVSTAAALYETVSPLRDTLDSILKSMNVSIAADDSDITLAYKIPIWSSELQGVHDYQNLIAKAGATQEGLVANTLALNDLINFIHYLPEQDDIVPDVIDSFRSIFLATTSQLWLNKAINDIEQLRKRIAINISYDLNLYGRCAAMTQSTSGTIQAGSESLAMFAGSLSNIPGPAGALGASLLNGEVATVINSIAVLASATSVINSVITSVAGCKNEPNNFNSAMSAQSDVYFQNSDTHYNEILEGLNQ